jgi:RHS repeat-associated protein
LGEKTYQIHTDYWYTPEGHKYAEQTWSAALEEDVAKYYGIGSSYGTLREYGLGLTLFAPGAGGEVLAIYEGDGPWIEYLGYSIDDADLTHYSAYGATGRELTWLPKNTFPYRVSLLENRTTDSLGLLNSSGDTVRQEYRQQGRKRFELRDHLGSVRAVITDARRNTGGTFEPELVSLSNYYPFGLLIEDYSWASDLYRYGFQNMEMENRLTEDATAVTGLSDQEGSITGEGKHYSTYFRMYDADLGRWWSPDPVTHPFQSPYTAFDNNPISIIDPLGADGEESGDADGLDSPIEPHGQTIPNPDGGSSQVPSDAVPLMNSDGHATHLLAYGNLFNYQNNENNIGFVDPNGTHLYYYQEDNRIKNENNWLDYNLWSLFNTTSLEITDFVRDPIDYGKSIANSIGNIDITATVNYLLEAGDEEVQGFAAAMLYGALSRSPKKSFWTLGKYGNRAKNAKKHFIDHGADFPDVHNATQYVKKAEDFFNNPGRGTSVKFQPNGDIILWNKKSNIYGAYAPDGTPRTLYKPGPKSLNNSRGHKFKNNQEFWNSKKGIEAKIW